jgi:hypothetical protein
MVDYLFFEALFALSTSIVFLKVHHVLRKNKQWLMIC